MREAVAEDTITRTRGVANQLKKIIFWCAGQKSVKSNSTNRLLIGERVN